MNLSLEKIHLPSIKANRSTKEAKIKEHRIDGDNLSPDSFKDKLMEEQQAIEKELMGKDEELKFDIRDVIVEKKMNSTIHLFLLKDPFTFSETLAVNGGCEIIKKEYWP